MGAAERVAEIERVGMIGQIEQREPHRGLRVGAALEQLRQGEIDDRPRPNPAALEIDQRGARTLHQVHEIAFIHFKRRPAFVSGRQ